MLEVKDFCISIEQRFLVRPRVIWQSKREADLVAEWLKKLDRSLPPRLFEQPYNLSATSEVPIESPLGRILSAGWQAVPNLLRELDKPNRSAQHRAHTLAMLYSITGEVDPRHPNGIRPEYRGGVILRLYNEPQLSPLGPYYRHGFLRPNAFQSDLTSGNRVGFSMAPSPGSVETVIPIAPDEAGETVSSEPDHETSKRNLEGPPPAYASVSTDDPLLILDAGKQEPLINRWRQLAKYILIQDPDDFRSTGGGGLGGAPQTGGGAF